MGRVGSIRGERTAIVGTGVWELHGMHERMPTPDSVLAYEPTADLYPSPSHHLLQAHITGIANDEVIKQCDIKKLPGIYELLRNLVIFLGGSGI